MVHEFDVMEASLPTAYRRDGWVLDLLGAAELLDDAQRAAAWDAAAQMFLDSMTWLLGTEEWLAGLQPAAGETTEDRRAALGAKWRASADKCGIEKIRAVCGSWNGVAAEVTYDGLAAITVLFRSWTDMPGNMDSVRQSLRAVIPAHLRYEIIAQLLRQAEAMTQLAAAGTHAKHYGEHEVTL